MRDTGQPGFFFESANSFGPLFRLAAFPARKDGIRYTSLIEVRKFSSVAAFVPYDGLYFLSQQYFQYHRSLSQIFFFFLLPQPFFFPSVVAFSPLRRQFPIRGFLSTLRDCSCPPAHPPSQSPVYSPLFSFPSMVNFPRINKSSSCDPFR